MSIPLVMTIDEIIAELLGKAEKQPEHERDAFIAKNNPVNIGPFTHYRDGARNLNTLIIMGATFTFADAPYLCGFAYTMPRRSGGGAKIKIENGNQSAACANNFVEFDYIARGSHYMQIEGLDYTFNQGEILFLNRDSSFKEYYYHKDLVIIRLAVSYSFFDSSLYIDTADEAAETFLHRFIKNGNRDFSFVRFIPQWESLSPPSYFEYVCTEFLRPAPRGNYLIIGFMERFLNALVGEYQYDIEWNDHFRNQKIEFEEIRSCLEKEYPRVTMKSLMQKYGCGVNHINRLFKSHTGLTYKAYLQNLRLEKARNLLLTTGFPISEVACLVGYKNVSHFYKIFREKFHILPNKIRRLG